MRTKGSGTTSSRKSLSESACPTLSARIAIANELLFSIPFMQEPKRVNIAIHPLTEADIAGSGPSSRLGSASASSDGTERGGRFPGPRLHRRSATGGSGSAGHPPRSGQTARGQVRLCSLAASVGSRAEFRLDCSLSTPGMQLWAIATNAGGIALLGVCHPLAAPVYPSGRSLSLKFRTDSKLGLCKTTQLR